MSKQRKIRIALRKNRTPRTRSTDWTRRFAAHGFEHQDPERGERVGKDALTRKRTVCGDQFEMEDGPGLGVHLDVDEAACLSGRVLSIHGVRSKVRASNGELYECAVRRLLKTLNTDQRHVVAVGDRVQFRPVPNMQAAAREGIIERIEPRYGSVCRSTRGRQQVLVTNVDRLLIVASAAEPHIKPHLIDRMLVSAEKGQVEPIVCINKVDLIDPAELQPLVGIYSQMGYRVLLLSAVTGLGIERLRRLLAGQASVVVGQSGVGKSSLLNVVDPTLNLAVQTVSEETEKGRHTTTVARLLPMAAGGYVVDTPGIRQFELWDVIPAEVAGFFRDLRPYVSLCRFPNCSHTHEDDCAVKNAVADGRLDERRYDSYCLLVTGEKSESEHRA
jgi:ribosome biogenesis GTPase